MPSNKEPEIPNFSHQKSDLNFIKDVTFSAVGPLVIKLRSFLFIPLLIRVLGVGGYGVWTQFEVTSLLLITIASLNLGLGINRFLAGQLSIDQLSDDVTSILSIQLAFGIILSLPILLFSRWFSSFMFGSVDYYVISICLVFSSLAQMFGNVFWAMMRAQRYNKQIAVINSFRWWGEFFVILVVSLITKSIIKVFVAYTGYQVLINSVYPIYSISQKWYRICIPKFSRSSQYLKFSLPLFGSTIGWWVVTSSDRYLIKWFLGIEAVGIYSAIYKFGNLIQLILVPLTEVLLPDIAALYDGDRILEVRRRLLLTLKYYVIGSGFTVVGIIGAVALIIAVSGGLPDNSRLVATILLFVGVGGILYGVCRILLDALSVRGRTLYIGAVWLILAVINIGTNLVCIPIWGITGAAVSVMSTYVVGLLIIYILVKQVFPNLQMWGNWVMQTTIFLGISLAVSLLLAINLYSFPLVGSLLGVAVFVILLLKFQIIGKREMNYVLSIIRR